ncbi:MAG: YjjG family noncanonical pyrimidine nucleotidase [bacterium]|nr:YjjG family noncanonical pyrimidine nucleotidase [bacterium]
MKKYKLLLWDIDGTILNFEEAERFAIRKGFATLGIGECTDAMLADYVAINKRYWKMLERGEMTKPAILEGRFHEFFERYGIDTSLAEEFNAHYQVDLGDTICFHENALELIKEFKNDYKQYAVTNGTSLAQHRKLERSGLADVLDGYFISDEVGYEKPNKQFFDLAFKEIESQIGPFALDEVMIIGDSLTSDILGGNNAGITTCWYNPGAAMNDLNVTVDIELRSLNELKKILGIH